MLLAFTRRNSYKKGLLLIVLTLFSVCSHTLSAQTTFTESASTFGLDIGGSKDGGHAFGDFDSDGDADVMINHYGLTLMRNNGNNTFSNVTSSLVPTIYSDKERQAIWGDLNKDGRLDFYRSTSTGGIDIYIQNSNGTFGNGAGGATPIRVRSANPAEIIINTGNGSGNGLNTEGGGFFDFDGDGDLDIYFDNHEHGVELLRNNFINHITHSPTSPTPTAANLFTHITNDANTSGNISFGLNQKATDGDYGSCADINDDGWVDIFMRKRNENDFFLNQGGTFVNGSDLAQANNNNKGSNGLFDLDNDGDFDAVWTENGYNQIFQNNGTNNGMTNWSQLPTSVFNGLPQPNNPNSNTSSGGIDGLAGGDIDNDGDVDLLFVGDSRSYLFINLINDPVGGVGTGTAMTFSLSSETFNSGKDGEGTTMVDIDKDGDLDIYMNINGSANQLYINNLDAASRNRNIQVLVNEDRGAGGATGVYPVAPAIGTNLVIKDCTGQIISGLRELGGAYGHGNQPSQFVHFGIPPGFVAENLIMEIRYPNLYNATSGNEERLIASVLVNASTQPGEDNFVTVNTTDAISFSNPNHPNAIDDDQASLCRENNVSVQINVLANDTDADGDNLYIDSIVTPPSVGSVVIDDADLGLVTYTYNESTPFTGVTFEYRVSDVDDLCPQLGKFDVGKVIINAALVEGTAVITNIDCFGEATGAIDLTPSGGQSPYTYLWSNGETTQDISNLVAGSYGITITDANGCTGGTSFTVSQPLSGISITQTITEVDCFGEATGAIDITVNGGTATYSYLWSNGATTQDISNLAAGTYSVTITDANGCTLDETFTITQPNAGLSLTENLTNVACFGDTTGAIDITVSGGTATYSYLWSNGATTQDISNLAAGTYSVTITDANSCTLDESFTITQPNAGLSLTENLTNVACFGDTTGAIDITVSGGTTTYSYLWSNGATTQDISNLAAGTYSVTITDANGCTLDETFTLSQPNAGLSISSTKVDVLCFGDSTGSIDLTVSGGTLPYTYIWTNGATSQDLTDIPADIYNVTVTDANGCTIALSAGVDITQPEPISIVITKENATTAQACLDGEATATPGGGVAPYTYLWSASAANQTTQTATNLPEGTHEVTVTDANNCSLTQSVVIDCSNTCDAIVAVDNKVDVLCTGDNTGSATVSASSVANPSATFTFTWNTNPVQTDTGVTSSTLSNIVAGVYTVSVTIDGTVCLPVEQSVTITEPQNALNVSASATDESGPSTGDGTATANATGGTPPYTYLWSPGGEASTTITNLSAGTYTVTVTDANGCIATTTVTVNPGTCLNLAAFAASTPVTCYGDSDGTATATVTGGSGNVTYIWNNGATTPSISGLAGGAYSVTVTDGTTQCTVTASTTVNEPNVLSSGIAVNNILCFGENTGSLDLTVSGGTPAYSFLWSNGATTEDLDNLVAGIYSVTITDINGCTTTNSATVGQPNAGLSLTENLTNIACFGDTTGAIDITVSGGTATYSYLWSNGATTQDISNLAAGTYSVTITDANGCTLDETFTITQPNAGLSLTENLTNVACFGDTTGAIDITVSGGTTIYSYLWSNGATTQDISNLAAGTYSVTITDANGCTLDETFTLSQPNGALTAEISAQTNTYCEGVGAITVVAAEGTSPYNFSIDGTTAQNNGVFNNITPGAHTVIVTDANGCTFEVDVFIENNCISVIKNQTNIPGGLGDSITYDIVVINTGNTTLTNIEISDPNATIVAGNPIASLSPGASATITAAHIITQPDLDLGYVENTAVAVGDSPNAIDDVSDDSDTGTDTSGNTISNPESTETPDGEGNTNGDSTDDPTVTILDQGPAIAIVKTGLFNDENQDQCSNVDETITYTFSVTNQGNVSLSGIVVNDNLLGGTIAGPVSGDVDGDNLLDVSEIWIYTASYAISQLDIDTGNVTNQATAIGTSPNGTVVNDLSDDDSVLENDPTITVLCQSDAIISIVKTSNYDDGGDCSQPGEIIDYTFTVTNGGNISLLNIEVTDPLLGGVVAGPVSGDVDGDGELDVDEIWIYTGSYTITQIDIDNGEVINQATVTGTAPNGDATTDESGASATTDEPTITSLCQSSGIALIKEDTYDDGGDCAQVGEEIIYTFTVTNQGNVSLSSIELIDLFLGGAINGPLSGDTDGDNLLDVSEIWIYTATYIITQNDIDAGMVANEATVQGTAPNGSGVGDLSDDNSILENDPTITELCQGGEIVIVKTATYDDGGDCSQPGEVIDYTFTVTNQGNVSISNIEVTDPLLGGVVTGPVSGDVDGDGELDVDEIWIYTGSYTITQIDIDNGEVVNQATVTGTAPNGDTVSDASGTTTTNDDPTITELCQGGEIAIVKTATYDDGGDCSQPGEVIDYTFTVTNQGNVSISNVEVTDPLLGGVVAGPVSGDVDGDGELDIDEIWIYTGSYTITQIDIDNGEVVNQATVSGTAPNGDTVSDASGTTTTNDDPTITELCQGGEIVIVKTATYDDGGDCSQPGEVIDYTFTVTNQGNVSISNIEVTDPLLGGVVTGPVSGDVDGDGELDVNEIWIYTGSYTITQIDIDNGEVVNQATVSGTAPNGDTVSDASGTTTTYDDPTITELCQGGEIVIVKTATYDDGGDCSQPGEVIDYTFTVTNQGNVSISNIEVTDPLLGGVVTGPVSGDVDGDGELDVNEIWIYTGSYTITQIDIDNGEVVNQATVTGTAPNGDTVSDASGTTTTNDDPTITILCQDAKIALIKVGQVNDENGDGCADAGETITYTFAVQNTGNVTISNITITDPLIAVTGGPITLLPDALDNTSFTAVYAITQADIDTGFVENQATVQGLAPNGDIVSDLSDDNSMLEDDPTITVLCQDPIIALIKVGNPADENGNGCADLGETIIYSFSVSNPGNVPLNNVIVIDPLVAVVGGPITLNAGETNGTAFTAIYTITQQDIDNSSVINQATVEGTTSSSVVVSDLSDDNSYLENDPTITDLCMQDPMISLEKTGIFNDDNGDGVPQAGETITYAFSVTNTGIITLYNVEIDDPLPGIEIEGGPIAILEPGETDSTTFTATYQITAQDIEAGEVVNQAFVTAEDDNGNEVEDESDDPNDPTNVDNNNDGDPDDPTVTTIPNVGGAQFEIFNGITPNGDGLNDFFEIRGIVDYPNNNVKIFNRWGVQVFETDGYNESDNVFRGISEGRATIEKGEELPTGTYFYILTFTGEQNPEGKTAYNGYLYINR